MRGQIDRLNFAQKYLEMLRNERFSRDLLALQRWASNSQKQKSYDILISVEFFSDFFKRNPWFYIDFEKYLRSDNDIYEPGYFETWLYGEELDFGYIYKYIGLRSAGIALKTCGIERSRIFTSKLCSKKIKSEKKIGSKKIKTFFFARKNFENFFNKEKQ